MHMRECSVALLFAMSVGCSQFLVAEPSAGIALKPDPPFAIDGDLGDWASVPNATPLVKPEQVVWGRGAWQSPHDLSGVAHIAWRQECLFIAVDVVDDVLRQTQRGNGIWKGDHVELYLDVQPDANSERDTFGAQQFHFAFSPGNFGHTGDPLVDCTPEAFCYLPSGGSVKGIAVAAKQTPAGWTIEAAIPWSLLGVAQPGPALPLRYEIAVSDTDTIEPQQECLMTILTAPWAHTRSRLALATLAGADGVPTAMGRAVTVFAEVRVDPSGKQTITFDAPAIPGGLEAVLAMDARLHYEQVAGYANALRLTLNDAPIAAERLMNKPLRVKARGGDVYSMAAGERFAAFYSPDFTSPDLDPHYGLLDGVKACAFEWKVTDLLRVGANVLTVEHAEPTVDCVLVTANARLIFRPPAPPPKPRARPPTGPLPRIEPDARHETAYTVKLLPEAQIEVAAGGETFVVASQFSTPAPGWVHGSCPYFTHERRIEQQAEAVIVRDTFTNVTAENLPLMHRHQVELGARLGKLWVAGLEQAAGSGSAANPSNPTTYAATADHGIGFMALDDVFRIHVTNFGVSGVVGIGDNSLVLRPHASYTAEWALVPMAVSDYWRFINAVRRIVDANFTIDGCFAFLRAAPETEAWSDAQIADFLRYKDARYACASIDYPRYKGRYTHGTAFQQVTHDNYRAAFERWRRLSPQTHPLVYFHCFIDVTDEGPDRFADARLLRPDGTQADYGEPYDRIYIPLETNTYGPQVAKNIGVIFDEIGANGVYWDEHEYSRWNYHYGEPWDGCSADIDPARMTISRLKSSVTLLTEPWRLALATRILGRGPLIGNGPPFTRAIAALKFPCFVETGSITNCAQAHLYSPIALGDHLTERSETDAYATMLAALDYGCVYHWYNDLTVVPTHVHLTHYMYPITPIELHAGCVIGRERILTKVSGLFGWGDASSHEAHVFDDTGREVENATAPLIREDGKTYTELRLAEGWSAAIMRDPVTTSKADGARKAP